MGHLEVEPRREPSLWTPSLHDDPYLSLEVADWLLEAGANVDQTDNYGRTALHEAVIRRHASLMQVRRPPTHPNSSLSPHSLQLTQLGKGSP